MKNMILIQLKTLEKIQKILLNPTGIHQNFQSCLFKKNLKNLKEIKINFPQKKKLIDPKC